MIQVSDIFIYPVKSLKGIPLKEAETGLRGFKYDREWMITDSDYQFLTQREIETMATITVSIANASFGIFFPKFTGTIYEILSAPISFYDVLIGFVGAAASKSLFLAAIILITASFFVDLNVAHPFWMLGFLILTCVAFSLFGFIIGLWAENFEKLQIVPLLIITPLVFLGGSFYSISMLPPLWQKVTLFNPVLYLVSGFRWSFFEISDVRVGISLLMVIVFLSACIGVVAWIFKSGYKLKQ